MRVQQISVFLENSKGSLAALCSLLGSNGLNLQALSIAELDSFGIARLIVSDTKKGMEVLRSEGYVAKQSDMLVVRVPDKPNGLADILHILETKSISIEYLYTFVRTCGFDAMLILKVSEIDKAEEALKSANVDIITAEQIEKQ